MAGKTIRVVYDPKVETSDSLSKFLGIVLDKAKYPIKDVKFTTQADYIQEIDDGLRHGNYTICLNKTYSVVSLKLSSIYKEPTYKFFSRYYANVEEQVIIVGLQVDVADIFGDENQKKAAWSKLLTFKKDFDTCSNTAEQDKQPVKSVEELPQVPEVSQEVELPKEEPVDTPPVMKTEEPTPVKKPATRKTTKKATDVVVKDVVKDPVSKPISDLATDQPSYEDLLAFYNTWKELNQLAIKLSNGTKT